MSRYDMLRDLLFNNPITACTVICRRNALISICGFKQPEYVPYVDRPTWLELGLRGDILAIDDILGYYRIHEHQVTSTMKRAMFKATAGLICGLCRLNMEWIAKMLNNPSIDG
jgi:hypothetical protein